MRLILFIVAQISDFVKYNIDFFSNLCYYEKIRCY